MRKRPVQAEGTKGEIDFNLKPAIRSQRRHELERIKKTAAARIQDKALATKKATVGEVPIDHVAVGKSCQTPASCSCEVCGNPRRHFGETSLQERSANELSRSENCCG